MQNTPQEPHPKPKPAAHVSLIDDAARPLANPWQTSASAQQDCPWFCIGSLVPGSMHAQHTSLKLWLSIACEAYWKEQFERQAAFVQKKYGA
eukprot:2153264-Amphidinium_carterae.1